jgi:hypothetical protein
LVRPFSGGDAVAQMTILNVVTGLRHSVVAAFQTFFRHTEAINSMTSCRVSVDRSLTPQQMLEATERKQYGGYKEGGPWGSPDCKVVDAMPRGKGTNSELFFFNVGYIISDTDLAREYDRRNLRPADPYSLCAAIEKDDKRWYSTHWRKRGKWYSLELNPYGVVVGPHSYRWRARSVDDVEFNGGDYGEQELFVGIRK